jgi:hypothetical protein
VPLHAFGNRCREKVASDDFRKLPDLRIYTSRECSFTMRFRLRTLLAIFLVVTMAVGALRWWYNAQVAEHFRETAIVNALDAHASWTYVGPKIPGFGKTLAENSKLTRATHLWLDDVPNPENFPDLLGELRSVASLQLLARQIIPRLGDRAAGDPLLAALRRHPSLRKIIVDASIRGAPLEPDAPLYTREDLAKLKAALPELDIVWIEVN